MITNPGASAKSEECKLWFETAVLKGLRFVIPDITDYEVRRELLRADKTRGVARLDALKALLAYHPISTSVLLRAAEFWAKARKLGRQTADDASLDADMILVGHAAVLAQGGDQPLIATTNVRHLDLFADARHWKDVGG